MSVNEFSLSYNKYGPVINRNFMMHDDLQIACNKIISNKDNLRLCILGKAGSGKTTLCRAISEKMEDEKNFKYVHYIKANSINHISLETPLDKFLVNNLFCNIEQDLFIFDGIDEVQDIRSLILMLSYSEIRNMIVASRPLTHQIPNDFMLLHISDIDMRALIQKRMDALLNFRNLSDDDSLKELKRYLLANPFNSEINQSYVLGKGFTLDTSNISIPLYDSVLPKQKTIDDIIFINNSLLTKVKNNPRIIHEISSRQFEEVVCELFEKQGYKVTLTQATKDGGKDIIVIENNLLGGFMIYVECKKYRSDRPIGVNLVRELYGTVSADKATAGILITSSYFSKDAISFQEKIQHQMSLVDYAKLIKLIQETCMS